MFVMVMVTLLLLLMMMMMTMIICIIVKAVFETQNRFGYDTKKDQRVERSVI